MEDEAIQFGKDRQLFEEFLGAWVTGQFTDSYAFTEMLGMLEKQSELISSRKGHPEYADEITKRSLLALLNGKYKGKSSLSTYIRRVVTSQFLKHDSERRRLENQAKNIVDESSVDHENRIIDRVSASTPAIRRALDTGSALQQLITLKIRQIIEQKENEIIAEEIIKNRKAHYRTLSISRRQVIKAIVDDYEKSAKRKSDEEVRLIKEIERLRPTPRKKKRYNELYSKFSDENITAKENEELLRLSDEFELLDAKRLENLNELAKLQGKSFEKALNEYCNEDELYKPSRPGFPDVRIT